MVNNVGSCIPTIEAQAKGQLLQMGRLAREREEDGSPNVNGFIAVIEKPNILAGMHPSQHAISVFFTDPHVFDAI